MRKAIALCATLACAAALAFALAACGSAGSDPEAEKTFVGSWVITEASGGELGDELDENIDVLEAFDITVNLDLNEDLTCSIETQGEQGATGTWSAPDAQTCIVELEGAPQITGTLEGGTLTFGNDETHFTCEKQGQ